jgi:hypothetical protein
MILKPEIERLNQEYYPNPQACWRDLGITRAEFSNLVRRGQVHILKFGGAQLVRRDEIAELRTVGPAMRQEAA